MKICVRENYIDINVLDRIDETELKNEPYNFQIVEIPDDKTDCLFSDFELKRKKFVFNEEKYNKRKTSEQAQERIKELKQILQQSDYKAIKFAEGVISEQDYESIKQMRQACRDEINELENLIEGGENE